MSPLIAKFVMVALVVMAIIPVMASRRSSRSQYMAARVRKVLLPQGHTEIVDMLRGHPNPTLTAGLFEGDIAILEPRSPTSRNAIILSGSKWPNNVVQYYISDDITDKQMEIIKAAMERIEENVKCAKFEPWDGEAEDVVHITTNNPELPGCWSCLGRQGGIQPLNLDAPCFEEGIIMHELMHTFGIFHEQSRPDRDDYVTINEDNIPCTSIYNFEKADSNTTYNIIPGSYDYSSLMHYGQYDFAVDPNIPTIIAKMPEFQDKMGQKIDMTRWDCIKLNTHLDCPDSQVYEQCMSLSVP